MFRLKKMTAAFLAVLFLCGCFAVTVFGAENEPTLREVYEDPYGRTLCAARKGYWRGTAENSLEAVRAAVDAGADIVELDVKKTKDGVLVLMADDTVTRTCVGYGKTTAVSELTYDEIAQFRLRSGEGGVKAAETTYHVPSLESVFREKQDCLYLLDADWSLCEEIYSLAEQYDMLDFVIFAVGNVKKSTLTEWIDSCGVKPMTMTYFKGNVIFSAISYVNDSVEAGAQGITLATKVPSGVVFGSKVMGKADGRIRTMANTAQPELCGTIREDTEVWWDELIACGCSIILTDSVPELTDYIRDCEVKKEALREKYGELVENWSLSDLKSDKYLDYKLAYNNAVSSAEKLLRDGSSARSDIVTATYELQKAYDDIQNNYAELEKGTAGMTVTPVRVALCIAAVAAVVAVEIFFYKKKKKV